MFDFCCFWVFTNFFINAVVEKHSECRILQLPAPIEKLVIFIAHRVSHRYIHRRKFHIFLMILLKMILFVYFLLKNLKMTQSLRLILWHASRFSGETSTSVRNFTHCFLRLRVLNILSYWVYFNHLLRRCCEKSREFLCSVSICFARGLLHFFQT